MKQKKINLYLFWSALFLGIPLLIFWIGTAQPRPIFYNANNYHPDGLKALNLFLTKAGFTVNHSQINTKTTAQILIVPTTNDLSKQARQKLLQWVKNGGVILELAASLPQFDLNSTKKPQYINLKQKSYSLTINNQRLAYVPKQQTLILSKNAEFNFLNDQAAFVYANHYGKGIILNWNDPEGLTNQHLKQHPDNAVILAIILKQLTRYQQLSFYEITDLINPAPVMNSKFLWNQIWQGITLCLLLLALCAWKISIRFGRPRPLSLTPGRSSDEFIISMANLWQRANIYSLVLENLWQGLLTEAAALTGLPRNTDPSELFIKVNLLTGQDLRVLIRAWETKELTNTKTNFLETARILDFYRKEFILWKKSKQF